MTDLYIRTEGGAIQLLTPPTDPNLLEAFEAKLASGIYVPIPPDEIETVEVDGAIQFRRIDPDAKPRRRRA